MSSPCGQNFETMNRNLLKVARENRITWFEGIPFSDRKTDFEIRALVVPITGKELLLLPEGDRFRNNIQIYTQGDIRDNDVVIYMNQPFEVQTVFNWVEIYRTARAMRLDVGDEGNQ